MATESKTPESVPSFPGVIKLGTKVFTPKQLAEVIRTHFRIYTRDLQWLAAAKRRKDGKAAVDELLRGLRANKLHLLERLTELRDSITTTPLDVSPAGTVPEPLLPLLGGNPSYILPQLPPVKDVVDSIAAFCTEASGVTSVDEIAGIEDVAGIVRVGSCVTTEYKKKLPEFVIKSPDAYADLIRATKVLSGFLIQVKCTLVMEEAGYPSTGDVLSSTALFQRNEFLGTTSICAHAESGEKTNELFVSMWFVSDGISTMFLRIGTVYYKPTRTGCRIDPLRILSTLETAAEGPKSPESLYKMAKELVAWATSVADSGKVNARFV